jgi:retinol dehydrogenase-12
LLSKNAKVYLAARSQSKAEDAIARLKAETGREALFLELDLGDLASVRACASTFLNLEERLHVLFENASVPSPHTMHRHAHGAPAFRGIMWSSQELLTKDGYDLQFGTNVIVSTPVRMHSASAHHLQGHFLLMRLLLPALTAASASAPTDPARVVVTSSSSAYAGALRWDTFRAGAARDKRSTQDLYNQSKLGNAVVAIEAARRFQAQNVVVTFVNPGIVKTELARNASAMQMRMIVRCFGHERWERG